MEKYARIQAKKAEKEANAANEAGSTGETAGEKEDEAK